MKYIKTFENSADDFVNLISHAGVPGNGLEKFIRLVRSADNLDEKDLRFMITKFKIFENLIYKYKKGDYIICNGNIYRIFEFFTPGSFMKHPSGTAFIGRSNGGPLYHAKRVIGIKDNLPIMSDERAVWIKESDIENVISINDVEMSLSANKYNL